MLSPIIRNGSGQEEMREMRIVMCFVFDFGFRCDSVFGRHYIVLGRMSGKRLNTRNDLLGEFGYMNIECARLPFVGPDIPKATHRHDDDGQNV